ncbi:hypothetical protein [Streptomyces flavofungini]|uniref:Uncharacterized protein n=1 Tax=Streptomyces flavofungini TaxID=68200 RepID=A0ABS0XG66_9ACTN|nr:hypothetical protein [Streptomyces flavofungini]MBJ3812219.1 hypothetical protein [Streptomyces flavofungini]GHC71358.1 hypothetical protein GCM10010349_47880 [Streptomyces flavofungini]
MPRIYAAVVGAFTLTLSLAAIPSAFADGVLTDNALADSALANSDGSGGLTITPSSVLPGARVKLSTVNPELDDGATVRSEAFEGPVELKSTGKVSLEARAEVRCDAEPGTYTVRFTEPVHPGEDTKAGKLTVEAGGPADGSKCADEAGAEAGTEAEEDSDTTTVVAAVTAGALAVAAAGAFLVVRRRRRPRPDGDRR